MGCGKHNNVGGVTGGGNCVCEVVRAILDIQTQAVQDDCSTCTTNCFLEPLGGIVSPARSSADTRVFTLLTKTGKPFMATFASDEYPDVCVSIYFRVEDVFDDCCATLRVLIPLDENDYPVCLLSDCGTQVSLHKVCEVSGWAASDSCITVDLSCFCAVQCIEDVNLGICN
ncbi:CotY/CotZ family spore coat protein [Lysinibacillus sp. KU-BSD001]|uniref:CotY/CotZ family spore coat protein n=1 Tax=Lysinibacillus sp. KU-BSD001 TaxID=3141328 RepID=UPI0036EA429C